MRFVSKMALAGLALGFCSTAASASVNLTNKIGLSFSPGPGAGETLVYNFDGIANSDYTYSGGVFIGNTTNVATTPWLDSSHYGAAENNKFGTAPVPASLTYTGVGKLASFSFDVGSLDNYNTLSFYSGSTLVQSFTGTQLAFPNLALGSGTGNNNNLRLYFTFGAADDINKVVFASTYPAFEFDNFAASVTSAVPEPTTWAMMILGFGFVGFMLRNGRRQSALAVI